MVFPCDAMAPSYLIAAARRAAALRRSDYFSLK
jgi:hypothetical protein